MVQLNNKKYIIILTAVALVVVISIIILVVTKNKKSAIVPIANIQATSSPVRIMTREEKVKVGISPVQEAEVVTDRNGLYIYHIKK